MDAVVDKLHERLQSAHSRFCGWKGNATPVPTTWWLVSNSTSPTSDFEDRLKGFSDFTRVCRFRTKFLEELRTHKDQLLQVLKGKFFSEANSQVIFWLQCAQRVGLARPIGLELGPVDRSGCDCVKASKRCFLSPTHDLACR